MAQMQSFPNSDGECFNSSLANLLGYLGHPSIANAVFHQYREHPLVGTEQNHVMHGGLATRLVHELTGGHFEGTLHINFGDDLEEQTRKFWGERAEAILRIIKEEREAGRIMKLCSGDRMAYSLPTILFMDEKGIGHAFVHFGHGPYGDAFIDNGQEVIGLIEQLKIYGVLTLREVEKASHPKPET